MSRLRAREASAYHFYYLFRVAYLLDLADRERLKETWNQMRRER